MSLATPARHGLFAAEGVQGNAAILRLDPPAWRAVKEEHQAFRVERFPLGADLIDLDLKPLHVTNDKTRFVIGQRGGPDRPFDFDPSSVRMFTGAVANHPGSSVFLAISDRVSTGRIDLGAGAPRYRLSSVGANGRKLESGRLSLFEATADVAATPDAPLCGNDHVPGIDALAKVAPVDQGSAAGEALRKGLTVIEIGIDTDYEFYQQFNDLTAEAAYITILYGAVSDIYIRDINARYLLTFVRLWDDPNDLYNDVNGNQPLFDFVDEWNFNMGFVTRDVAQLVSGRRDFSFGGIAYLNALCTDVGYGVVGYMQGSFPTPGSPNVYSWDFKVAAHELGHNCSARHTPDYTPPIDRCYPPPTIYQRGTIMSYCSQTVSGGNAVEDEYFHRRVQAFMKSFIGGRGCLYVDCNSNDTPDNQDIASATSPDVNGNGVPDECEDCNGNGILDTTDIAGGMPDLNGNTIPDVCEPDCNANNVPDDRDIALGTVSDAHGNNIPDSCETDCNSNGVADYTEIQADLNLDVNRNALLDACEDCDNNASTDEQARDGAWDAWIVSRTSNTLGQYHALSGVRIRNAAGGALSGPQDVVITADRRILVSSANDDRIVEFDRSAVYVADFVSAGSGGLNYPTGMAIAPNGNLYVSSRDGNSVLEYDGGSGAFVRVVVAAGTGVTAPHGLAFGPDALLYVTSSDNRVAVFDPATGAFVRDHVSAAANGGLVDPRGVAFLPNGHLLVVGFTSRQVHEYDALGAYVRKFNNGGTLLDPWGVRVGPNGNVFVSRNWIPAAVEVHQEDERIMELHVTSTRIYECAPGSGNLLRSYIIGDDTGLTSTGGFAFMPGSATDCNINFRADACDIASGSSLDLNGDGTPDECACAATSAPVPEVIPSVSGAIVTSVKNRYLSFAAGTPGLQQAIRVTFTSLPGPFAALNGTVMWAGQPRPVSVLPALGFNDNPGASATITVARLQCQPHFADWGSLGMVHAYHEAVVPAGSYTIQALGTGCDLGSEPSFSAPLDITNPRWGDVASLVAGEFRAPDGSIDVTADIIGLLGAFAAAPGAPSKPRADLEGGGTGVIDGKINIAEVVLALSAFTGATYPFPVPPAPCP